MKFLSRVVWSEGMHLAQHHFQVQSRFVEDSAAFARTALGFASWGLAAVELDDEALLNGSAALVHAAGILPDGAPFEIQGDLLPEPLDVASRFHPTQTEEVLVLTVAPYRDGQPNCSVEPGGGSNDFRYVARETPVRDEVSGQEERTVTVACGNFHLSFAGSEPEGNVTLPLARIRRDGSGNFAYDPDFIPPALRLSASPRLVALGRRIVDMLEAKAGSGVAPVPGAGEMTAVWLSHAVHSSVAPIRHAVERPNTHPEELYAELVRLAGSLCTFSLHTHPRDLPLYQHDQLERVFGELDLHIRRNLEVAIPTSRTVVSLTAEDESFSVGTVADTRGLGAGSWFVGLRSDLPQAELIEGAPRLLKICSHRFIQRLVKEGRSGLSLRHTPSPPPAVAPRPGYLYFEVDRTGACWRDITDTKQVGVYSPAVLNAQDILLVAIWEADE